MLRKQQYDLIVKFKDHADQGKSLCHQMIMGAGKTTVVAPMLSLLLGDGEKLVLQVMPKALLQQSLDVLRQSFSVRSNASTISIRGAVLSLFPGH